MRRERDFLWPSLLIDLSASKPLERPDLLRFPVSADVLGVLAEVLGALLAGVRFRSDFRSSLRFFDLPEVEASLSDDSLSASSWSLDSESTGAGTVLRFTEDRVNLRS